MRMGLTVIDISAGFLVLIELITKVTGADRAGASVTAEVGTTTVIGLTAIHNLHLYPVALLAIFPQLIARVTSAFKGATGVETAVRTPGQPGRTFIQIFTAFAIRCQSVARVALTVNYSPAVLALVHAASVPISTWVPQDTVLAILCQLVIVPALALMLG